MEFPGTDGARGQFFSPDGQWIAFHAEGKLRKVPAAGGPPVVLCDAGELLGGSWADDSNIYATLDSTGKLWRIPSNGGQPVAVIDVSPGVPAWPQVLPGSNLLLFTNGRNGADAAVIEALSLKDGSRKVVTQGGTYGRYLPNGYLTYVNGGTLFAVAFNPAQRETRGTPVAILNDVSYSSTFGYAHAAVSQNGTLVYRRSTNLVAIEWLYPSGKTEPLLAKPARYVRPSLHPTGEG